MESLLQDIRYGFRMLWKSPGFTAVAVLSLGLGIGANTSIFTVMNDLLLKSLPVRNPQHLVAFGQGFGAGIIDGVFPGSWDLFSYEFYKQIENQHEVFEGISAFASFTNRVSVRHGISMTGPARQAFGHLVSGNYFGVLGVDPVLGRPILPSDADAPGRSPVAVISNHYWQQEFFSDPHVLGETITVNGTAYTVIGVMPTKFYGVKLDENPPDMWLPITMQAEAMLQPSLLGPHGLYWIRLMGRSKPGISMAQMREWVNVQLRRYMSDRQGSQITQANRNDIRKVYVDLMPGGRGISDERAMFAEPLRILMGAVILLLLIACANLANFLLSKATSREREISTRLALGAGRGRIVRQMLTESLLLSFIGGALGLLLASWGTRALINFVVSGAAFTPFDPNPDARVLAFTFGVSLLAGIVFGVAPALRVSRVSVAPNSGVTSRTVAGDGGQARRLLPKVLVASQVALSLVLLLVAGLFIRTLHNLEHQDFGFDRQNVLLVDFDAKIAGYKTEQLSGLYQQIMDRMESLPGVRSASLSGTPPIHPGSWNSPVFINGYTPQPNEDINTLMNTVAPHYFETVGIPLVLGRAIGAQDTEKAAKVAVVNQTLANHFFPHGNVIGQHFHGGAPGVTDEWEIVGVVKDTKYNSPRESPQRMIYFPVVQLSGNNRYVYSLELRTVGDPQKITEEVRRAMAQIDSNLPALKIRTIAQQVDMFMDKETLISQLCGFFSLLALLLACIGLYGTMTYNVLRRTNEIGIRMALGAQLGRVLWMVLRESLWLLGIGAGIGIPLALAASYVLRSQLFGLSSSDPLTLSEAMLLVALVTVLAGYLPARRATKIDPMVALRYE